MPEAGKKYPEATKHLRRKIQKFRYLLNAYFYAFM
jgi:hypothetical protein